MTDKNICIKKKYNFDNVFTRITARSYHVALILIVFKIVNQIVENYGV